MAASRPNLFTRDDTMFGVCQGIGEDFGFNPDYLRVALPLLLFIYPVATIIGYFVGGVVLFAVHWFVPADQAPAAVPAVELELVELPAKTADDQFLLAA